MKYHKNLATDQKVGGSNPSRHANKKTQTVSGFFDTLNLVCRLSVLPSGNFLATFYLLATFYKKAFLTFSAFSASLPSAK